MKSQHHILLISIVSITIFATIGVQVYWNFINYQANKAELISQVQITLDNAVESYYADIARGRTVTMTSSSDSLPDVRKIRRLIGYSNELATDTVIRHNALTIIQNDDSDTNNTFIGVNTGSWRSTAMLNIDSVQEHHLNQIDTNAINLFASKIIVSMRNDNLDFDELSGLIKNEFDDKSWAIDFGLLLRDADCQSAFAACDTLQTFGLTNQANQLLTASQSALLPNSSELEIHFSNISSILLKRSFIGIALSLLLSAAIILCLLYLFKTINQQKQLAEIKNDLISNITHEFKTPITTISTALEGIENFNGLVDNEKTKKYIGISNSQLGKLNTMVEKLLETASMDSEHLELKSTKINLAELVELQLAKYRLSNDGKTFVFSRQYDNIMLDADAFHIESVISNLLDNAVKYGGDEIKVNMKKGAGHVVIQVIDNGLGIAKDQRTLIFDKFYRIPKGNVHDVKGFGIGLYYAKNIIEKHGGQLILVPSSSSTKFEITLPYGS